MIICEFTLDSPILAEALSRCPAAELSIESQNALGDGTVQLQVWGEGVEHEAFGAALEADPTTADGRLLFDGPERWYYDVRYSHEAAEWSVYDTWADLGGQLLASTGSSDGWELRMRFPDRAFARFYETCEERGLDIEIRTIYGSVSDDGDGFGLTECQREALSTAHEQGYFDVPRGTSLDELAAELGVSDTAVSQRLRRGVDRMLDRSVL
ncbi:helix-turn-helix domain-containing protein [Halobium salinum]|uniref:Helix-turn-helix domain-containing protein n=1 Tax=Halobium salinum TaxID=1364940 RepID=A0ABD5PCK3_9EURY|nr:helix-turn-helix domain-containing protein [Halobium salinum]